MIKGPAPRALDLHRVTIERDKAVIDLANPIRRSDFSADQLVYSGEQS